MNKETKNIKKGTIIAASVVGALVVIYLAGSIFFQSHYLPRTVINGISCTGKNADGVKDAITSEVKNYKLTIQERREEKERNNYRKGCQYFRRV